MKKILTSLIFTSTAISAPALAWVANGTGGTVELSGTLTPSESKNTPWEVYTGESVSGLDATVSAGAKTVTIPLSRAVPVLGIRTQASTAFAGQAGISPQIDYHGHVDTEGFNQGMSTVTLSVMSTDNPSTRIGTLTAPFAAAAVGSVKNSIDVADRSSPLGATRVGRGFWGGLGQSRTQLAENSIDLVNQLSTDIAAHFDSQGLSYESSDWGDTTFMSTEASYSAYYGGGLLSGTDLTITLNTPATGDCSIPWKATLPVTVSYM